VISIASGLLVNIIFVSYNNSRDVIVEVFMNKVWKLCFCYIIGGFLGAVAKFPFQEAAAKVVQQDQQDKVKTNETTDATNCRDFIQKLANEAIKVINTPNMSKDKVLEKFTDLVSTNFSVNHMAKFAIGQYVKTLEEEQKKEFLKCFTKMLVKLYAANFEEYKSAKFMVTGHKEKSKNRFLIESKVIIPGKPENIIVWHVSCVKGEGFRITDAVTNEISIRQILRAEIGGNISEKGLKKFLAEFSKKYGKI
jgi:ABC-type transporter MlaC component